MNDSFGDRMKGYERVSEVSLMPLLPTFARVDGRAFHTFTKGMERPYDKRMARAMTETMLALAMETNATMAYTQSDEITLMWYSEDRESQIWFDGRHSKMVSQVAAHATLTFFLKCMAYLPEFLHRKPTFDARVWQTPNRMEATNVFVWRELDATRNSVSMAASSMYSPKELHGKNGSKMQDMLMEKGVNWNDYPAFFKRGTYAQRRRVSRKFSVLELEKLPPLHEARQNPDLMVERSEIAFLDMPPITKVENREAVVFDGAEPVVAGLK